MMSDVGAQHPNPRLHEEKIGPAIEEFVRQCASDLGGLGFRVEVTEGHFDLNLSDDPILTKAEVTSRNGRCFYKGKKFANSYWPHADDPGIYFFFNDKGVALYVGKCENELGFRIAAHLGARGPDSEYEYTAFPEAKYFVVVPMKKSAAYLAPALESWFLKRYHFPMNRNNVQSGEPTTGVA